MVQFKTEPLRKKTCSSLAHSFTASLFTVSLTSAALQSLFRYIYVDFPITFPYIPTSTISQFYSALSINPIRKYVSQPAFTVNPKIPFRGTLLVPVLLTTCPLACSRRKFIAAILLFDKRDPKLL
jgi:hypothetical protein